MWKSLDDRSLDDRSLDDKSLDDRSLDDRNVPIKWQFVEMTRARRTD